MRIFLFILLLLAGLEVRAVVPPFQTVVLTWDAVSATNQMLGYRFYLIDGVTGATNYVGMTVTNRFTLTNVTATPQRWFVTTTNPGNESVPCFMAPFRPEPPEILKPVSTTFRFQPPGIMERSSDLAFWNERFRLFNPDSNGMMVVSQTINPIEPFMFYRIRPALNLTPPPLP